MKLDRNEPENFGRGKYALIKIRELDNHRAGFLGQIPRGITNALRCLKNRDILDEGLEGSPSEFFVIRLKDKYAKAALQAYADAAAADDPEWAADVSELAKRSGPSHPYCKRPD